MSATIDIQDIVAASLSDVGGVRPDNQDQYGDFRHGAHGRLLIVADGMGGHRGGAHASHACVDAFSSFFRNETGTPEDWMRSCFERANDEIWDRSREDENLKGMGTTGVAIYFAESGHAWVGWVGDSRCYRWRDGKLDQLTEDHSLVEEWVKLGVLTPEEAENHPRKSELTRAIGVAPEVEPDICTIEVEPGDRFMLCSDGLSGVVHRRAISVTLSGQHPEQAVRTLIERAKELGSRDNITVQVVAFGAALSELPAAAEPDPTPATPVAQEPRSVAPPPRVAADAPVETAEPAAAPVHSRPQSPGVTWQAIAASVVVLGFLGAIGAAYYARTLPEPPPPPRPIAEVPDAPAQAAPAPEVAKLEVPAEPAPSEVAPPVAEPEPVVTEPEPVVTEPEPVVTEPEPVVTEPEPVEPAPIPAAAEAVVVAEPTPPAPAPTSTPTVPASSTSPRVIYVPVPEPVPTSAAFELAPPIRAFVDAWLEAAATRDYAAFAELGFAMPRSEWDQTYELWESFRLTGVEVRPAPRPDRVYLRAVLSYAFHDPRGRWRTEDEHRLVLVETPEGLRFEARWK